MSAVPLTIVYEHVYVHGIVPAAFLEEYRVPLKYSLAPKVPHKSLA